MHIVFLNGSIFRGNWQELIRALWHPLFIALVLGMAAIILLAKPYEHILPAGVMLQGLIVASCVYVFMGTSLILLAQAARRKARVPSLAFLVPSVVTTSIWGVVGSVLAGGNAPDLLHWGQMLAFNFVFCIMGEIFLASFLLRRIAEETGLKALPIAALSPQEAPYFAIDGARTSDRAAKPAPQDTCATSCEVLGQRLMTAEIWHLKAEEHYVKVGLRCGKSMLLRGNLADAITQLPKGLGKQVHRSHWVAKAAIADLLRKREGWRVCLRDGSEVPVARNRQNDVRDWAETHMQNV